MSLYKSIIPRFVFVLLLTLGSPITYAQSPTPQPTKKEIRQQKKELKQQRKEQKKKAKEQLPLTLRSGQEDSTKTKRQFRQEKKLVKQQEREQLDFKADSIKIAAMLQLRNTHEANQVDSLKRVMKNSKELAKVTVLEQEKVKEITQELDPYLETYKAYKSKLKLDSASKQALIAEGKTLGLQELKKREEYDEIKDELDPYTEQLDAYKGKLDLLDSANLPDFASQAGRDQLIQEVKTIGLTELEKREEFKQVKDELTPYLDSPYLEGINLQDLDSLSLEDLKELGENTYQKLEKRLEQEIMKRDEFKEFNTNIAEFEALKGLPESYKKQFEKYKNGEGLQKEAMVEAAKKAQALLSKHSKEIQSAQTQLTKLKKKYSSVQSSNDLSTATKRNSLQGQPFKKRMVLGINFQIVSIDPVIIDFNPVLGYRIDKKFHLAIGGSYRARFTESHANNQLRIGQDELTYGYRAFGEYNIWKIINIHAEYERISKEFEIGTTDTFERKWVEGAMAGIATNYTLKGMVKGNASILYNFLYEPEQAVYTSPWVFRFGVDFGL